MSSCRVPYIENLTLETPEERTRLTNLHIKISRILYSHRTEETNHQVFTYSGSKLYVGGKGFYFEKANDIIFDLNMRYGDDTVKLTPDPLNPGRNFVSVDVRKTKDDIDEQELQFFDKKLFGDSDIVRLSEEFQDLIENNHENFAKIASDVQRKASIYLKGMDTSSNFFNQKYTKDSLIGLLGSLKDKTSYGLLESISRYVSMSNTNIRNISSKVDKISEKLKNLSMDSEERANQLEEIADFTRHSSYYYHLFDILEDFESELMKLGFKGKAIDNYERDLLETNLKRFMTFHKFSDKDTLRFLNRVPSLIEDSGKMFLELVYIYKTEVLKDPTLYTYEKDRQLSADFDFFLDRSIKKNKGIQQQLANSLSKLRPLKSKIKSLHEEVLTEVYYPTFAKTFEGVEDRKTIDGKETVRDRYFIDKESFKLLLNIGEKDISSWSMYGSAMINMNGHVENTIANYFKTLLSDVDYRNKEQAINLQEFLYKNGKKLEDLGENNANYVHENLVLDEITEVPDDYEGTTLVMNVLGMDKKFIARRSRNYLNEYNNIAYDNNRKVFLHYVQEYSEEVTEKLIENPDYLVTFKDSTDPILRSLYTSFYQLNKKTRNIAMRKSLRKKLIRKKPNKEDISKQFQDILTKTFFEENLRQVPPEENDQRLTDNGVFIEKDIVDLEEPANILLKKHVLENSYFSKYKESSVDGVETNNLTGRFYHSPNILFGKWDGGVKTVVVRYSDYTLGTVKITKTGRGIVLSKNQDKDIMSFATFSGEYSGLADKYKIQNGSFGLESKRKWDWIHKEDPVTKSFNKEYFERLITIYKKSNQNYGALGKRHREVPQVPKSEFNSKIDSAKTSLKEIREGKGYEMMKEYGKSFLYEDTKRAKRKDGVLVDEEGNPTDTPVYESTEKQYINNQRIRTVSARFIDNVPVEQLEDDLYKSTLAFFMASNSYGALKKNESQALLLETMIVGDSSLGIDPRKTKVKDLKGGDVVVPGGAIKLKDNPNSSKVILSAINDYVFNETDPDYSIGGLSAKKLAQTVSGFTAYTALALNLTTMPSNRLISLANTRAVSKNNRFFKEEDWWKAVKVYNKNYPKFYNDFKSKGFTIEKSTLTQLLIRLNGIQGEFLSPSGIIETKDLAEKMSDNALFFTQEVVEHANQTESMIMMMMGYKLPSGQSFWEAFEETNKDRQKGEPIQMPSEITKDMELDFQKKLQGVNRQIHGNYSKLDKNLLQRGILSNMFMTFRKYIYDGFRSKYMEARWDQELKDEEEGYFRTYLKSLNTEFSEIAKTQGLLAAMKSNYKDVFKLATKTTVGAWDAATMRVFSKNNKKGSEWLYGKREGDGGDITDRQHYASMRATYEMGNVVRAMLMVMAVEAILSSLGDDDDENVVLKGFFSYADIYAHKLEGDIGFFTSFTNFATGGFGGPTRDQFVKLYENPFAASRTIDNVSGIYSQLIDFDLTDSKGDFSFGWGALDKYEKSGNGYEKGDFKIAKKAQKSILSPWYQLTKLADFEAQLNYLNLSMKQTKE